MRGSKSLLSLPRTQISLPWPFSTNHHPARRIWNPLDGPAPVPVMVQNPAKHLDHARREIVAARYYDLPAEAIELAAREQIGRRG